MRCWRRVFVTRLPTDGICWNIYKTGKKRIDVQTQNLDPVEQEFIQALEYHCFKTKGHLKRGQGLTSFPWYKLATSAKNGFDVLDFLDKMFEKRKKRKSQ